MTRPIQARLLRWAAAFLFLYSLILTLSPSVRERALEVDYRLSHWLGFLIWGILAFILHREASKSLPDSDPYLLPAAALLSGWGLMTIWRLDSTFGMRQLAWLCLSIALVIVVLRLPADLAYLRRYKYLALAGGLLLTTLTLLFGTNPIGIGPRLWLGCCGVYFQPSEPLKLLLVIYLAAYFADRFHVGAFDHSRLALILPLAMPTLVMTGVALAILLIQRDLGTASIFLVLYTILLFVASGKRRVLLVTASGLVLAALVGYFFIDIVHVRLVAWLDPWTDPSGRSYQIIQSLLAIANGGALGRGPGLGAPGLVPVAISDFVFAALAEETGLLGAVALLALFGLLIGRGVRAALLAPDRFRRLLAAGLTAYLGVQALLILGGNLRLLPLTGVTLPFVSYGGSSLVTSFLAVILLLRIGGQPDDEPASLPDPRPYPLLGGFFLLGLTAAALATGWWAVVRGPDLLTRTDNARRSIADRYVPRGDLLDRRNMPITVTRGERGSYMRQYLYPALAPVVGYTDPIYGQGGLEATLDDYLRGLQGNPASLIWWNHLLYGTPPPGLDVRLSIDLDLQRLADESLGEQAGAVVLLNAQSGEILVMASAPTYDPNRLGEIGESLLTDPSTPLVNRAAQGSYPIGDALDVLQSAYAGESALSSNELIYFYETLGFLDAPELRLPVGTADTAENIANLRVSPLQMALAGAVLSNDGTRPAPRIALAVDTPQQGWVILPALGDALVVLSPADAKEAAQENLAEGSPYWEFSGQGTDQDKIVTWYMSGTPSGWQGTPLTVVILIEADSPARARSIGQKLLDAALGEE